MYSFPYFWGTGRQRAGSFFDQGIGSPRESEVCQFDPVEVFREHEHVFRSHVPMDKAFAVHELEGGGYLLHDDFEVRFIQSTELLDSVP